MSLNLQINKQNKLQNKNTHLSRSDGCVPKRIKNVENLRHASCHHERRKGKARKKED